MVGLSVVLESGQSKCRSSSTKKPNDTVLVINKTTMINKPSSSSSSSSSSCSYSGFGPAFLDQCFLCNQKLLPTKDIYMYKGDRAFCSVECRFKQIFMDEEESIHKEKCSFTAKKPTSSSSSSSSSCSSRSRKGARNRTS